MPLLHPSPPPASPLGDRTPSSSSAPVMASPGKEKVATAAVARGRRDHVDHARDQLRGSWRTSLSTVMPSLPRVAAAEQRSCSVAAGAPPQPPSRSLVVGDGGSDFTGDVLVAVVVAVAELSVVLRNAKRRRKTVSLGC
nr:hypothetical protein Itr_chr11CG17560 [Ipomoea trifida]